MSEISKTNEVIWPVGYEPPGAPIYAVNDGHSRAPRHVVWSWLVRPDQWPTFYRNARRPRSTSGSWPEVTLGSTFTWVTFGATCTSTVTEFEPFERFAFTGGGMGADGHHAWVLTDDGEGGTNIHCEETQRGTMIRLVGPLLQSLMRSQHQGWVDNLARTAETGRPL
jgi:hypothetical protein